VDKIIIAFIILSLSAGTALACQPVLSITPEPSVVVTETPSPEPTASESATPTPTVPASTNGDGLSDGLSDGHHQAPDGLGCAVHECKAPAAPPATGRGQ
jgi:hypothetical protein